MAQAMLPSQCERPAGDQFRNESKRQLDSWTAWPVWPGWKGGLAAAVKALLPSAGIRGGRAGSASSGAVRVILKPTCC
jgi:hypothetical protein